MKTRIPKFKSLEEERKFWDTHEITDFLDEIKPAKIEFKRPRRKLVSIRLDAVQIQALREIAARKGLGYLTLIRSWISERLIAEHKSRPIHH